MSGGCTIRKDTKSPDRHAPQMRITHARHPGFRSWVMQDGFCGTIFRKRSVPGESGAAGDNASLWPGCRSASGASSQLEAPALPRNARQPQSRPGRVQGQKPKGAQGPGGLEQRRVRRKFLRLPEFSAGGRWMENQPWRISLSHFHTDISSLESGEPTYHAWNLTKWRSEQKSRPGGNGQHC